MLIFAIVALIPVTYLFINRSVIHRESARSRSVEILVAVAWGVVYALLVGIILGPLGILAAWLLASMRSSDSLLSEGPSACPTSGST